MILLKKSLQIIIDRYGIEQVNQIIEDIFEDRRVEAEGKNDEDCALYWDELAESYGEINRKLQVRPFRDDQKKLRLVK